MTKRHILKLALRVTLIGLTLSLALGASPVLAARDRTPPTKPANLRVTSTTPYQVSLAWNPSSDNSGTFSYRVWVSYGATYNVPQTQTSFTLFVAPNNTY